jgi:hypothetical protein
MYAENASQALTLQKKRNITAAYSKAEEYGDTCPRRFPRSHIAKTSALLYCTVQDHGDSHDCV